MIDFKTRAREAACGPQELVEAFIKGYKAALRDKVVIDLKEFARHEDNCRFYRVDAYCTCGFWRVLDAYEKAIGDGE